MLPTMYLYYDCDVESDSCDMETSDTFTVPVTISEKDVLGYLYESKFCDKYDPIRSMLDSDDRKGFVAEFERDWLAGRILQEDYIGIPEFYDYLKRSYWDEISNEIERLVDDFKDDVQWEFDARAEESSDDDDIDFRYVDYDVYVDGEHLYSGEFYVR